MQDKFSIEKACNKIGLVKGKCTMSLAKTNMQACINLHFKEIKFLQNKEVNTNYKNAIKKRFRNGMRTKELDLSVFHELSEKERILAIHYNSKCCFECYKTKTAILFRNLSDGFTKMGSMDEVRPSNRTGISDPTANIGMKRAAISEGKLENAYTYGESKSVDMLIELERSLKLYEDIISLYDDIVQYALLGRMNGREYDDMADEMHVEARTLRQYVCASKEYLDEYYDAVTELVKHRK